MDKGAELRCSEQMVARNCRVRHSTVQHGELPADRDVLGAEDCILWRLATPQAAPAGAAIQKTQVVEHKGLSGKRGGLPEFFNRFQLLPVSGIPPRLPDIWHTLILTNLLVRKPIGLPPFQ